MGWREAVGRGWRVIPVSGKIPQVDSWQMRGTLEPEAVPDEDWPRDWSDDREYGILTGPASGLLVLDIDVKADGPATLAAWEREYGELPPTYTVRTGSGGQHRYFAFPPQLANVALKYFLCPGVEVKGIGRQVVGEGSLHESGRRYELELDQEPVAPPAHLVAAIARAARDEHPERREARVDPADILAGVEQGQQNNKLFAYTCSMRRRGVLEPEAVRLLQIAMDACDPPYRKETAVSMVDRVWQTYEGRPVPTGESTWKMSTALEDPDDIAVVAPGILTRTDGVGLFYPASVNYLFGPPGSLKSWVTVAACAEAIEDGYTICYLDFEDKRVTMMQRPRGLGLSDELIQDRFYYARPREQVDAGILEEQVFELAPVLVVLDGMNAGMALESLDSEKGQDVTAWYDRVPRRLTRAGAAVLITDHVVKDPEARGKYGIGSERKLALVDGVAYQIRPVRTETGLSVVRLHISKDRIGKVQAESAGDRAGEVWYRTDGTVSSVEVRPASTSAAGTNGQGDGFKPTWYMEKVSRFIEENPGCSSRTIDDAVGGKTEARRKAVKMLVDDEYVAREGSGSRYSFTSKRPYREGDDDGDRLPMHGL